MMRVVDELLLTACDSVVDESHPALSGVSEAPDGWSLVAQQTVGVLRDQAGWQR